MAGPPTAPAVAAEGASCAARAVPSDSVPCMLAARRVPTDRFADGVPGAGREPSASLLSDIPSLITHVRRPGRCVTFRRLSHTSDPDGQAGVNTEMRLVSSTSSSSASPHGPNPPARKPDDLWAAVRERRADLAAARAAAAAASPNPDQGRHKVRARLSQERNSVRV